MNRFKSKKCPKNVGVVSFEIDRGITSVTEVNPWNSVDIRKSKHGENRVSRSLPKNVSELFPIRSFPTFCQASRYWPKQREQLAVACAGPMARATGCSCFHP